MKITKQNLLENLPYIILIAFFVLAPVGFNSRTWLNAFITIFVFMVGSSSLRTIALSGNMSFAHGAFTGIGAYVAGVIGKELGLSIFLTVPLGALAAMLIGLISGWPFARLRSIYFCMGSMFMGVAIVQFISSFKITGGANGLRGVPSLGKAISPLLKSDFGKFLQSIGIGEIQLCYYIFLFVTLFCLVCLFRFEHSRIGWTLKALAQSPEVAASTGINEMYFRLLSVGVGCFFTGLIGALYAHYNTTLSPNSYGMSMTLWLLMYMMIGGTHSFLGPIVGALTIGLVRQIPNLLTSMTGSSGTSEGFAAFSMWVGKYAAYTPFLTAFILLLVVYVFPKGLISIPSIIGGAFSSKRRISEKGGAKDVA